MEARNYPIAAGSSFSIQVEEELIERLKQQDDRAFARLYELFARPIYYLALRMSSNEQLAEDVVQIVFLELLQKINHFRHEGAFAGWVRRIAVNKTITAIKQLPQGSKNEEKVLDNLTDEHNPDTALMQFEMKIQLADCLKHLSADSRVVLWLYDVEGFTHKEIADFFGKTVSFSKSCLARSYQKLRCLRFDHIIIDKEPDPITQNSKYVLK